MENNIIRRVIYGGAVSSLKPSMKCKLHVVHGWDTFSYASPVSTAPSVQIENRVLLSYVLHELEEIARPPLKYLHGLIK